MCGLTGFLGLRGSEDELRAVARTMAGAIAHRGPDDSGELVDAGAGLALGFRRLAIIDLSTAGHQPMSSASGRYAIAFNGEVYNFEAIRAELVQAGLAPAFRGHSDTEVMLAAIEAWGLTAAVRRFIGMFAIALWDRAERRLHLVRDRMGVKPMYYGFAGGSFVFGSELKALRRFPGFDGAIDRDALALYFEFLYVPAPFSIYRDVRKQMPGTILSVGEDLRVETTEYWSVREVAEAGVKDRFRGDEREAADLLHDLLRDSVGLRMISDVPLGVFLSGGVDSSLVTALMQEQSTRKVKTFAIGFTDASYDEAPYAAAVAAHLGTEHTEMYVGTAEAFALIPRLPEIWDEPFADSSQIPTQLVSAMARRHVTVSLSGDGGDELFGGYSRYFLGQVALNRAARIPRPLRKPLGRAALALSPSFLDRTLSPVLRLAGRSRADLRLGERIHKMARVLSEGDRDRMYFELVCHWRGLVEGGDEGNAPVFAARDTSIDDPIERMMFFDQISYLPDDILVKVDRASMSVSLEAREPLLDHRIVELAWRMPLPMKTREAKGKWLMRDVLDRYVPSSLIERPKMGFGLPIEDALRTTMRDWAESLLSTEALNAHGLLDTQRVRALWRDHVDREGRWHYYIWAVLMFQAWYAKWCSTAAIAEPAGINA